MAQARSILLFLLVACSLLAPVALSQQSATVTDIRLLDANGTSLRIVPKDGLVTVAVTLNNTSGQTLEGPLKVNIQIAMGGTNVVTQTVSKQDSVAPGNETVVEFNWAASNRMDGDYAVTAQLTSPGSSEAVATTFKVAGTSVPAGSAAERFMQYYWVFGLFLLAFVLFIVVVAARRS